MGKDPRLTIVVARDGKSEGLSMLAEAPHKFSTFNPYNVYFDPKEVDYASALEDVEWAKRQSKRAFDWPEHLLMLAVMLHSSSIDTVSFPEAGVIPGAQSAFMMFVVKLLINNPDRNIKINTVSEYMIRMLQVIIASKMLAPEDVAIYDQEVKEEQLAKDPEAMLELLTL